MKKSHSTTLAMLIAMLVFTACTKESDIFLEPGHSNDAIATNINVTNIKGNQANIKLVQVTGFDDPCFNIYKNNILQGDFRFTGGYNLWVYSNLQKGLHTFSFTCDHPCDDENGTMQFQIDDGSSIQSLSAKKTGHCRYEFSILAE